MLEKELVVLYNVGIIKQGVFMFKVLKECLSINLNEYENININLEINKVILAACGVFIIFIILFDVYRMGIRSMVNQLIRHGAKDEESAKSLKELGLEGTRIIRVIKMMLARDNLLTKVVARSGEKKYSYEEYKALSKEEREENEKIDFSTATFYVKEEQSSLVSGIVEKYGTSVQRTALSCSFVVLMGICLVACMPGILNVLNNILKNIKM